MKKMSFLIFLTLTLTFLLAGGFFIARAQDSVGGNSEEIESLNKEINARKDRIKQLEETMSKYRKNIEQKQLEAVSLRNQLSILDNRIAQLQTDIGLTQEKIKQAELEIEALLLTIQDKERSIEKQKTMIAKMVQDINIEGRKNYVEILLTNDSFSQFYDQFQYLQNVYIDLGRSVRGLKIAKDELEQKKAQVMSRKQAYDNFKQDLEGKKDELAGESHVKTRVLTDTKSSEQKYRTLLESLRRQYQSIEGEIRGYEETVRKKLEEQEKIKNLGSASLLSWPVPSRVITAIFHDPDYPYRRVFEHSGIDIRASQGTPALAAAAGYVARAKRCSSTSCYSYALLVHTGNLSTLYGHLSSIAVGDDQFVNRGDVIGYTGGTPGTVGAGPFVTGPHLHFETRMNGIPVDPMQYMLQ